MDFERADGPLVYAFRCDPSRAVPGTIDAFDLAEAEGADGLYLEVRLTSDGDVVVFGEAETTIAGRRAAVSALTVLELLGATVGSHERERPVPLLRDVLGRYGPDLRLLVELKPGHSSRPGLLEARVASLLGRFNALGRSTCRSASADSLRKLRETEPRIETGVLLEGALPSELPAGARSVAVARSLAESYLNVARPLGIGVHALGVTSPDDVRRLSAAGVASLVTDRPADVRCALASG